MAEDKTSAAFSLASSKKSFIESGPGPGAALTGTVPSESVNRVKVRDSNAGLTVMMTPAVGGQGRAGPPPVRVSVAWARAAAAAAAAPSLRAWPP